MGSDILGAIGESLQAGAESLQCALTREQLGRLVGYLELLVHWNRVYNLTAIREPLAMVDQHLLDCLAVVGPLRRQLGGASAHVLDAGSGAGLPGVVLGIAMPELTVTCVDAVGKKASFIRQAAAELGLPRVRAVHARTEALQMAPVDVVASRAYSSLSDLVQSTAHLLKAERGGGAWMAMKGKLPSEEIADLPVDARVFHVEQLIPASEAERCLVWMRPTG